MPMLVTLLLSAMLPVVSSATPRIDAAHSRLLQATVTQATVVIKAGQEDAAANFAREQLHYFVGPLNGYTAGADIGNAVITLARMEPQGDRVRVQYSAKFTVAWPIQAQAPVRFRVVVPLSADREGKQKFFNAYGRWCESGEEPADASSFFYFFRPERPGCTVLQQWDQTIAIASSIQLAPHTGQTQGKKPEYEKMWEDGRLVMTFIGGTYADGATSSQDVGVANYNRLYQGLRQFFGNPISMNVALSPQANPGLNYPNIEMTFLPDGVREVNINLLLIQKSDFLHPSEKFLKHFQARTEISDLVSYNGHSGLGSNIRAFAKLGKFVAGQYQLFFINGCDTFTYVDDALPKAHAAANPGFAASKHLDLITNAMPSTFDGFTQNAIVLSRAIWNASATYREILSGMGSFQKAIVTGEEDND